MLVLLQDINDLSVPLTSNLHELLESVKQLGNKVLSPSAAAADAASKQLLPELAGGVNLSCPPPPNSSCRHINAACSQACAC